jgi:asparagine synthase (glutamine-hydrolysing)
MSDHPIGLFISGGLDSSIITDIATRKSISTLHSFASGLKDYQSSDLYYARKSATFLGTIHHEVIFTTEEGLESIRNVIKHLESYDVTTLRANTPMYLLSKWIMNNTDIRVILTGEAPDESTRGYLYFHYAPSLEAFQTEIEERVNALHLYDVLRCGRATAAWSLKFRVPYLDKKYLNYMVNLPSKLKHPKYNHNI